MPWIACALFLVVAACGRSREEKPPDTVPNVTVGDFEQSAFYRRHPPSSRETSSGRIRYRFGDRYSESKAI